ncbi:MAG: Veg family protein [Bacilli bacterium]|nr:Veg family protein [Bacilli bacterium]
MNTDKVKNNIGNLIGKKIVAKVNMGRNKFEIFEGIILNTYPALFTIKVKEETKSFSYADVLTKNIIIKIA